MIRYDSQAIASEFVKKNRVEELLNIVGIKHGRRENGYVSPKHEAIASLLIFDEDTTAFRKSIFDSLIKSYLSAASEGMEREKLVDLIIADNNLSGNQAKLVNSHVDRLLQKRAIKKSDTVLKLKKHESDKFLGLRKAGEIDFIAVKDRIVSFFDKRQLTLSEDELDVIIAHLIEFMLVLYRSQIRMTLPRLGKFGKRDKSTNCNASLHPNRKFQHHPNRRLIRIGNIPRFPPRNQQYPAFPLVLKQKRSFRA